MTLVPIRLKPRPNKKPLAGTTLRVSTSTQTEYAGEWLRVVEEMIVETTRELTRLFSSDVADVLDSQDSDVISRELRDMGIIIRHCPIESHAMDADADLTGAAARILKRLIDKFIGQFDRMAQPLSQRMVDRTLDNSATALNESLKDVSQHVTIDTSLITPELQETIAASVAQSVGLIKRVPQDYLSMVQTDVMLSITSGNGLADLIPALDKRNIAIKNWSRNTALDQTRKVYSSVNRDRMEALGVQQFEWVHSGGSNAPREYHMQKWPNGLNGGIFSLDDLPVIDKTTGERGIPGQTYNCRCTMRPIISFKD